MSDIADKALDYRTKAIIDMVGRSGDYEAPKSKNMLSHLTNDRAFNDYQVTDLQSRSPGPKNSETTHICQIWPLKARKPHRSFRYGP